MSITKHGVARSLSSSESVVFTGCSTAAAKNRGASEFVLFRIRERGESERNLRSVVVSTPWVTGETCLRRALARARGSGSGVGGDLDLV